MNIGSFESNPPLAARVLTVCILFGAWFVPSITVHAENGRDFAGQYTLSDVINSNGTVNAKLKVRVVNFSGRDLPLELSFMDQTAWRWIPAAMFTSPICITR